MIQTRRDLLGAIGLGLTGIAGCMGAPSADERDIETDFEVTSRAISEGEQIPTRYTCDGADQSPPLTIGDVPAGAAAVAIVLDDPDAPDGTFVHWLLWNLPADRTTIPETVPRDPVVDSLGGARQGTNDFGELGYRGPCPPGGAEHLYRFTVYALDAMLDVEAWAEKGAVRAAIDEHQVGIGQLTAPYG